MARAGHELEGLLVATAMLEGCGYYDCKDSLKAHYVPPPSSAWRDARTLEVSFAAELRAPTEVDPRRFALLRYDVDIDGADYYSCAFEVCYREPSVHAIPESLEWDPAQPWQLLLHFADAIPSSACDPAPGHRADFQALELIYLGEDDYATDTWGETGTDTSPLDQLAYTNDELVDAIGPPEIRQWLQGCLEADACNLVELCVGRGGFERDHVIDRWFSCP